MQKLNGKSETNLVGNYKVDRFTLLNSTSNDASIFAKKIPATAASGIYQKAISLQLNSSSEPKFNSGTNTVGKQPRNINFIITHKQNYNPNRCFSERLGGILSENLNRRSMDSSGVNVTYQSTTTQSYKSGPLTFHKIFSLKAAHFQVDNTTALSYLMKMGGTGSREMTALAKEIWEFALSQKIIITAEYLSGKLNVRADWVSRNFQDSSEWLLSPKVLQMIWGTPDIGLFASRACHQLQTYISNFSLPKSSRRKACRTAHFSA